MLAKYWKKIGMVIVIVACVFNVMIKLINKLSLDKEMVTSAQYVQDNSQEDKQKDNKRTEKSQKVEKNEK